MCVCVQDSGMTVSTWDMYDTYQAVKEAGAGMYKHAHDYSGI